MTNHREQLSCLMDGEMDRKGARFFVRRVISDREMQRDWQRFHLIRSCLHKEFSGRVDLVARVSRALDGAGESDAAGGMPRWARTAAGGAIAASVALVAVLGINQNLLRLTPESEVAETEAGFVSQPTSMDRQFSPQPVPVGYSESANRNNPDDRRRISSYIVRHQQAAGSRGFISYTPILTEAPEYWAEPAEAQPDRSDEPKAGTAPR